MMDERFPDDDKDALAALSNVPPPRKAHSYSQQLRVGSGHKHHRQVRKHSLDEERIPKDLESYYDSSDDDFIPYASNALTGVLSSSQRLDQSLAIDGLEGQRQPLPEFTACGGENAPFKAPVRAPVHPNRPPCLELRPHPLRETQVGKFLRTIACTDTQLWAGLECGVRFWNFADACEPGCGLNSRVRRGDEDAAPFHESTNTSAVMCLIVDLGNKLVWGGHKDGKIRSWKAEQAMDDNPFKEGLSWQAHKGPVHSLVMTSYGDIWSGSEGGFIKIWPWEAVEKSLMLSPEERHMAALLVERSYIDLRSQVTVNGVCNISSADVKFLLSDNIRAKVWCAASLSFSLWDARTRELLKVFNVDGQIENRVDMSSVSDQAVEDEMKVKFVVSTSKKEKSQGSSFLQRSRNAIMGAADAVRRVATKGANAFSEDSKRTEALLQTADGMIWSGCANGTIVQWDGSGNRIQDFSYHTSSVQCFCTFGTRIYVGYSSGMVQLVDLEGKLITGWIAHNNPVLKLAVGSRYVFSLAAHGGVRGWNIVSPGPLDTIIRSELAAKEAMYTRRENLRILVGTWNVGQGRTSHDCLISWLGSVSSDVAIVVVGLQEVEMGAGFLAMSAAKETVGLEGSTVGQSWQDTIGKALDEGSTFERIGSRQLAGLLITLWVRKNIRTHVGDIDAAAVPCGFGRAIGNKGAVGLRIRIYDRIICFVNCHFAAHLDAVNRRNADFDHVYRTMTFNRSSNIHNVAAVSVSSSTQIPSSKASGNTTDEGRPELSEADMVVFLGDFNYRLHGISYDEARDFVSQRCFDWLREKDQLRAEMKAGKVFQGMREAVIRFPPTYKFERHQAGLGGYDSGEKKRIPAWCDRVLFRDTCSNSVSECGLECPVVSSVLQYEACMDVTDSDHKPVRCKFHVEIAHAERSIRRKEFGLIVNSNEKLRSLLDDLCYVPDIMLSTNSVVLQNQDTSTVRITNKSTHEKAIFRITCEGLSALKEDGKSFDLHPARPSGLPTWLEVTPGGGVLKADQTMEICVRHVELHTPEESGDGIPQNWWSTDTRDKLVIMAVNVQSTRSTEIRSHRISVRCCFSTKTIRVNSKSNNTLRRYSGNSSHHSSAQGVSEA